MTTQSHVRHIVVTLALALGAVLVEALAPAGALGHYQWAAPALAAVAYVMRMLGPNGGPPVATAIVVLAPLAVALSCSHVLGPVPPPGTPGFVNCSETALHDAALNVLPSVENALATASYEQALATLIASEVGPLAVEEVECAVQWIASQAMAAPDGGRAPAEYDPLEATKEAHARAWLAAHPVTFAPGAQ
jgi:hypothetical protein